MSLCSSPFFIVAHSLCFWHSWTLFRQKLSQQQKRTFILFLSTWKKTSFNNILLHAFTDLIYYITLWRIRCCFTKDKFTKVSPPIELYIGNTTLRSLVHFTVFLSKVDVQLQGVGLHANLHCETPPCNSKERSINGWLWFSMFYFTSGNSRKYFPWKSFQV